MKKRRLLLSKKSIWSRTLIYFMVMALSMITLLWAVQEWFFANQYSNYKQREVVKIMNRAVDSFAWPHNIDYFTNLLQVANDNNMVVFFFSFDATDNPTATKTTADGQTLSYFTASLDNVQVLSPTTVVGGETTLNWTAIQEDRFIRLLNLNGLNSSPILKATALDTATQRLQYAAKAGTLTPAGSGRTINFYFYAEAAVSNTDVAIDIIRFEFMLLTVICVLLAFVFSILLSSMLSAPISKISKRALEMAAGNYDIDFGKSSIKEINDLSQTLSFAAGEFSKTEQMRRDFIANISHDLRTPLTMVKAYAEMIRDITGFTPEKRKQHAQVIIDEAGRLSSLVEDIQKLSKIQAGTDQIKVDDFDICELCAAVVRQFSLLHEQMGLTISFLNDGGESAIETSAEIKNEYTLEENKAESIVVRADRDKISQVLYNLVSNAINYAGEAKAVVVRVEKTRSGAVVEVIDYGKGIAEDELDAVWDRYYRANQVKRTVVGSGLGLSIVRGVLVAHGAEYGVRSQLGEGTTFWFKLPYN